MKLITLFFILIAGSAFSQSIVGEWIADCYINKMTENSYTLCDICPTMRYDNHLIFIFFQIKITNDSIFLFSNDTSFSTKAQISYLNHSISFEFNKHFEIFDFEFIDPANAILEDQNKDLIHLKNNN